MKMFTIISVLMPFCGLTVGLVRKHTYVNNDDGNDEKMAWDDAQAYCRGSNKDLSTITSEEENQMLIEAAGNDFSESWIGLNRANTGPWFWSDGQPVSFFNWENNSPPNNSPSGQSCCKMQQTGWDDDDCNKKLPFFCYKLLVLVNETMTWDEANEYCRSHHTGLARLNSESQSLYLDKTDTNSFQAALVWAGLRFLNGQWIWVNGKRTGRLASLPSCPAPAYRCGARNFQTNLWENRNCEERLNVLCY